MKQFRPVLVLLIISNFFCTSIAQKSDNAADVLQQLRVDVIYLASDYLEGRETGKRGEALAAQYIASRFQEAGLKPKGDDNGWFQSFDFKMTANPHSTDTTGETRTGKNVVGYLDNGAPTTVIIGAHYDHLGNGAFGSRHVDGPAIHNGADDNASGVAALLRIASYLSQSKVKNNNYLFIAFSGEELGLYGSKHFVNNPTIDLAKANYMLNMDMVGKLNEEKVLIINGAGTSPVWKEQLEKIKVNGLKIQTSDSGVGPSDHTSFYLKDMPVLHFFTGSHEDYHKPGDDSQLLNYDGIYDISNFIIQLIEQLNTSGKLEFSKTKDEQGGRQAAAFKVTLGVMPDYAYTGKGMRVDAVLDDRPAAKADIKGGDILIQIGELEVKDIYDYMKGLSNFKSGEKTKVIVKRGEQTLEKEVVF